MRDEVARSGDTDQLIRFARRWLYEHKLLIPHDRALRSIITNALGALERETAETITTAVASVQLQRWRKSLAASRPDGQSMQSRWWAAPAKHSVRQISEAFERIDQLYALGVDTCLQDISGWTIARYAKRLASRPPSVGARIKEPARTVEVACYLLANLVMAWNTMQMQQVLQGWANRRQHITPELMGKIAPTRIEGINLRGVFRFPTERYANEIMLSLAQSIRARSA